MLTPPISSSGTSLIGSSSKSRQIVPLAFEGVLYLPLTFGMSRDSPDSVETEPLRT